MSGRVLMLRWPGAGDRRQRQSGPGL